VSPKLATAIQARAESRGCGVYRTDTDETVEPFARLEFGSAADLLQCVYDLGSLGYDEALFVEIGSLIVEPSPPDNLYVY